MYIYMVASLPMQIPVGQNRITQTYNFIDSFE